MSWNVWKCTESCMGSGVSCEIKLVHDNTPNKCMTNGKPVKWSLQNTAPNRDYTKCPHHGEIAMYNEDTKQEEKLHLCKCAGHFA